jgi:hypothetical protein
MRGARRRPVTNCRHTLPNIGTSVGDHPWLPPCDSSLANAQDPAPPPAAEPTPRLDLYGFALTDTGHDFETVDPNWFDVLRPTKLPSFRNEFGGNGRTFEIPSPRRHRHDRANRRSFGFRIDGLEPCFLLRILRFATGSAIRNGTWRRAAFVRRWRDCCPCSPKRRRT